MNKYYSSSFAQAYGESTYGSCEYSETTAGCAPAGSTSGQLTDTGFLVVAIVTLACVVLLASILVRFWRRSRQAKLQPEEAVEAEEIDARTTNDQ